MKDVLHYTQEQTDDVGAAKDFGSILGLLSGFFFNYYPPWVTIYIGSFIHLFGYSMVLFLHSNGNLGMNVLKSWLDIAHSIQSMQSRLFIFFDGCNILVVLSVNTLKIMTLYSGLDDSCWNRVAFILACKCCPRPEFGSVLLSYGNQTSYKHESILS